MLQLDAQVPEQKEPVVLLLEPRLELLPASWQRPSWLLASWLLLF